MGAELKPCPFCGGRLLRSQPAGSDQVHDHRPMIGCPACKWWIQMQRTKEIEAIVDNRPTESALRTQVEGLEGEVERLSRWNLEPEEADSGGK